MTIKTWNTPLATTTANILEEYVAAHKELHEAFIETGLVQRADTGQLDFDAIAAFPAQRTFDGYCLYDLDDGNSTPLVIKVGYGIGNYSTTPQANLALHRFSFEIGFDTDGAGEFVGDSTPPLILGCDGSAGGGGALINRATGAMRSDLCITDGFLGLFWKQRVITSNGGNPAINRNALDVFICRDTDDAGLPIDGGGISIIAPGEGSKTGNATSAIPIVHHLAPGGVVSTTRRAGLILAQDTVTTLDGAVPFFNLFTPKLDRFAQVAAVNRDAVSVNEITDIAIKGTTQRSYLVCPSALPADIMSGANSKSCFAMLWE